MNVDVVIPAHNAARSVGRAVRSAFDAGAADVVVGADRCHDDTAARAERAGARVFECAFGSPALTRNAAVERASSPFVAFLDADDHYLCAWLHRAIPDDERWTIARAVDVYDAIEVPRAPRVKGASFVADLIERNFIVTSATLVERAHFEELGGFSADYFGPEDWDLWLRLASCGAPRELDEHVVAYVHSAGSIVRDPSRCAQLTRDQHRVLDAALAREDVSDELAARARASIHRQSAERFLAAGHRRRARAELRRALPHLSGKDALAYSVASVLPKGALDLARRVRRRARA